MLTIHTADLLIPGGGKPPLPGGAVLVEGRQLAAVEVYDDMVAAHPSARVRRWPGVLAPGLVNPYGPELLEQAYHPDPREELGSEPISGEALESLDMTDTRWGASARRGVQRLLAQGTVAVVGPLRRPAVIDAVHRSGLTIEHSFTEEPLIPLLPGMEATFAAFETQDLTACVATVIKGRLLHRRR
ncbi:MULTISPECIES: hypothetical protein [Streptomyces]|uniref:Uncharacterized protein n=1 Tax=Streptomyces sviceus (strain ATCC 29083 / DSM 924 / JCM 4929 / NBRC 13980 / NCIMB 11184 / NRRL 5439 / UC 5370) TaxID=463191 RepID=B5HQE5_STRX2|nr:MULTISPECIES: hypothetical protein [Streptomyces]EDY55050.1 conserved hypothetical protein [Streptomyces sviceus ATCC 29083]MYT07675.1 hypothetical protein [Streptomyces sp. SID5470]